MKGPAMGGVSPVPTASATRLFTQRLGALGLTIGLEVLCRADVFVR
jgi:hypothetical protein